ncbi:MAG: glutamate-ammonia-ligase adenylyltransferase [marine bacterium B5-7]|nr:MAG: glutamate-ammonia-ligase adenylyltransferase [marine bacterium B5-7]
MSTIHDEPVLTEVLEPTLIDSYADHPLMVGREAALGFSRFLVRNLKSDRELGQWILDHPASREFTSGVIADSARKILDGSSDSDSLYVALRVARRRLISLIAWADLTGVYVLEDTMAAVSELADCLIGAALDHLYDDNCRRFGRPMGALSGEPVGMVVLGLGKLGGRELNFSSDVDLIFVFPEPGETDGAKTLSNEEFFVRLGRKLVKFLDEPSRDGFVFRTDMRLRPNGDVGPLALSFDAMEHYYQAHGRDWERYALIKARVIAGDHQRGVEFMKSLRPFVYRKYMDFSAFESIRKMKLLIDRELKRKGRQGDVKLGRGGIREVEFIVQSHQLIRGGREPALQTSRLIEAMNALVDLHVLTVGERDSLMDAYRFLRNTEHRLQMVDDQQTQQLPKDDLDREALGQSMGYSNWSEFQAALAEHRDLVQSHFSRLFQTEESDDEGDMDELNDVWLATRSDNFCQQVLAKIGFTDAERSLQLVRGIRSGRVYQGFSKNGRDRLDRMLPRALAEISATRSPDQSLVRLISIIEGIGKRSAYFALLAENQLALKQLIQLIASSAWIAHWIGRHPVILDELLDPIADADLLSPNQIKQELGRRLNSSDDDMEAQMDLMREFKNGYLLRIAARSIAGLVEPGAARRGLSDLADVIVGCSVDIGQVSLTTKVREQVADIKDQLMFGVVGYGKLGGRELSYTSDLDLVFLYDSEPLVDAVKDSVLSYYFSRLVQRIMLILSTTTRAGVLYETDIRLRPSGRSGTMVSSVKAFTDYQHQQAWTWEHQALVRARMVVGSDTLIERFEQVRRNILCQPREDAALKQDIVKMRKRMSEANSQSNRDEFDLKLGEGGIVDIEFVSQYFVLANAANYPQVIEPRGTMEILESIAAAGLLDAADCEVLVSAYREYLARELTLKLEEQSARIPINELVDMRERVVILRNRILGG